MNIINKSILNELKSHIAHEKFIRNLQTFVKYLPTQITELAALSDSGDMKTIEEKAHMLKGTCGQFGAMRLHEMFSTIESRAHDSQSGDVQTMVRMLPFEFELVQEVLSRSVATTSGAPRSRPPSL
jgi:HPt (histidine-containing phosphotransfer) domain-containing protein